jgi:ketosteroid isomerase-like protein
MPSENVDVVRRALDAVRRQDLPAFFELADPDIELDFSRRVIDPTVLRGHEGVRRFSRRSSSSSARSSSSTRRSSTSATG